MDKPSALGGFLLYWTIRSLYSLFIDFNYRTRSILITTKTKKKSNIINKTIASILPW